MPLANPGEMPDLDAMKAAMAKAEDPEEAVKYLEMVVYGKPKRGKTHFLGTVPNILILDFDHGSEIITRRKFPNFRGKRVKIESFEDVAIWYWILSTRKHPFEAVAWDTATMAMEMALQQVLNEKVSRRPDRSAYKAEMDDYGRAGRIMRTWLARYRSLPMHKFFVCHEREVDHVDEAEGEQEVTWLVPDLQGSVRTYLLGLVNLIGYAYVVQREGRKSYRITFNRRGTLAADRFDVMPRVMANPTFDKVWEKYQEVNVSGDEVDSAVGDG